MLLNIENNIFRGFYVSENWFLNALPQNVYWTVQIVNFGIVIILQIADLMFDRLTMDPPNTSQDTFGEGGVIIWLAHLSFSIHTSESVMQMNI